MGAVILAHIVAALVLLCIALAAVDSLRNDWQAILPSLGILGAVAALMVLICWAGLTLLGLYSP